ncbi:MAG: chemotaxis protein CheA [Nitrospirae bacterium]|nr:chemotaxis protein CheA [Nitrospirota bacterium]
MEDIEKLKETFYSEADDILSNLDELLLQLEHNPGDKETLDAIFRSMHTLKGTSSIFEFHSIEKLAHACEDLLDLMRKEEVGEVTSEKMIDTLFTGSDQIKEIITNIQNGSEQNNVNYENTVNEIRALLPKKEHIEVVQKKASDEGMNRAFIRTLGKDERSTIINQIREGRQVYQISIALSKYCFYKGMDPLVLLKNLTFGGEVLLVRCTTEHIPSLEEINPYMLYLDDIWMVFSTTETIDFLNDIFEFALAIGDITVHLLTEEELTSVTPIESKSPANKEDEWGMSDDSREVESGLHETVTSSIGLKNIFLEFMEESNSYIEDIESSILKLEKDKTNLIIVNDIFRPFHTIKGNCGYLGFKELGHLCHSVETLLDNIRNSTIAVNQIIIDTLLETVDAVKKLRLNLPQGISAKFGLTDIELSKYPAQESISTKPLLHRINFLSNLNSAQHIKENTPKLGEILLATGDISEEQLNKALRLQERKLGEILVDEGILPEDKVKSALEIQELQKAGTKGPANAIKVDIEKVDCLVNLVGELVITQTLISQNSSITQLSGQSVSKDIAHLGKITRDIQDHVMSMRMMPLNQTFQKMMRVVRDTAKKAGKNVELIISGEDTELDKTVIEEVSDPLVHILRNSVDHGIETPEARKNKGKPEKGTVHLNAFHRGGNIVIEIKDDGKGLNRERIIEKAIERGLINDPTDVSEQQIYQLIFYPGFSTAEKVTDISGRGVGMDVVRKNIDKLRGRIDIQSKEDQGTTISITLPLTLAIIDGMVVQTGIERYIIPTLSIEESLRPKKEEIITVQEKGELCNLRGALLPILRLNNLYNKKDDHKNPCDALLVVVENDGMRACILVDELIGQQQVVIKTLGDTFKNVRGIAGGAILGDGKVGLILDVRGLIEASLYAKR